MDFLDSLKSIKKEMQANVNTPKLAKKSSKSGASVKNLEKLAKDIREKNQETNIDKEMQEIFLKQEKLQDEFSEFIKNADIKKI
ncbi:hypothetical protein C3H44_00490 [Campylobacter jejuni]|uniref:hypothetical protein n=1 Tax=Campylobacter jejuni TaxID=197 RepID=UPI000F80620F|nr:hypothetical protein [Campylobacter jejuni]RTI70493.1 hypothetical protein C3I19_00490 [Campylobacter jejuni]RTI78765.1 hypothetical protein C3I11_00470 [Campylobacter jejuni]RTI91924.1 hypothetical protein C3I03_00485 [Campylobacter jejuni]RTJ17487.1 hypothetical protein C3H90_00335 [Campylobacter jejuni]RTJ26868.1 hypothetical protein C3H82_00350 [Campylobacter jejuni]